MSLSLENLNEIINETITHDDSPSSQVIEPTPTETHAPKTAALSSADSYDVNSSSPALYATPTKLSPTESSNETDQATTTEPTATAPSEPNQSPDENQVSLPPTTSTQQNSLAVDRKSKAKKRQSSDEETIEILDESPDSCCIDLTDNDEGEIIIEKSVGLKQKHRVRNRLLRGPPNNNLDATIVIDDDSPQAEPQVSPPIRVVTELIRRPFPSMPVRLPIPFPFYERSSRSIPQSRPHVQPPLKRTRVSVSEKSDSEKRKEFLEKLAASNEKAAATTDTETQDSSGIQCPICLESLAELKKNKKRLKSTTCGHILCNECLEATFRSSGGNGKSMVCPTCRTKLTKAKIHDLFL